MLTIRRSEDRGHANFGWLDTYHTFSFGRYYDAKQMQFRDMRVMNEDRVKPGEGFGTHPHDNMEIISYVVEGALGHKDSMGHSQSIEAGEVQVMTAGSGITHSEYNHSSDVTTHLLQIWILPEERNLQPRYDQKKFSQEGKRNAFRLIVSRDGQDDSLTVHQDVRIYDSLLEAGKTLHYKFDEGRYGWLQLVKGSLEINGVAITAGDGARIEDEDQITIKADENAEFLLFNLK